MTPADLPRAKLALIRAMNMGFGREIEDEEPVDLGLVEFEKKTQPTDGHGRGFTTWLRSFCGSRWQTPIV